MSSLRLRVFLRIGLEKKFGLSKAQKNPQKTQDKEDIYKLEIAVIGAIESRLVQKSFKNY
ncbi:MAG: hypothetical protein ACQZ3N_00895 [cyanobacterium endosymbiont of Rhopalodia yunnanensis]